MKIDKEQISIIVSKHNNKQILNKGRTLWNNNNNNRNQIRNKNKSRRQIRQLTNLSRSLMKPIQMRMWVQVTTNRILIKINNQKYRLTVRTCTIL
jgi:hypothetical protein